ncbi:MAG: cytochrome C oxidase subunit IV family protein [Oceanospirillaceae bacterium]|nr:cytochrome C oxidase subunit IV family protein [Oceanospirillaceae bacterium]MCP5350389.1 cytochrome C oxidase subunit IV family protein [Oceanospirillaceae bacterium]
MSCIKTWCQHNALLLLSWSALLLLSLLSVNLGSGEQTRWVVYGIMGAALLKGWLIVEHFMELRHAGFFWRGLLLAWPLCIVIICVLLYRFA